MQIRGDVYLSKIQYFSGGGSPKKKITTLYKIKYIFLMGANIYKGIESALVQTP